MFETLSEERSLTNDSLIEGGQEIKREPTEDTRSEDQKIQKIFF